MTNETGLNARRNVNALLTNALTASDRHQPLWAYTLTQHELAEAATILAHLVVTMWALVGWEPNQVIANMVAGTEHA